ncbi:hypothetical protein [Tabrizicola flagellatus]|uniref:hypothetical protein n=1 Tax=Tabrizicola flagellatus TaxID=2593021 RepID=UPI0011F13280|nr:hypothetical protein [Tabrizicola flagellatus]
MRMPAVRELSDGDRNMLKLLLAKYFRRGYEVYALDIEGPAAAWTMGFQLRVKSALTGNFANEFRFQKYSGGLMRARWVVSHRRLDLEANEFFFEQHSWVTGLANALAEAEDLMAGKRTPYSSVRELAEAVAAGWT